MTGLVKKSSKLGDVGSFGLLSIALASVSAVLFVIATAFTGGGLA
jgi:hypothetical protein